MCTISYVPTASGFFLTQNRDVEPDRFASQIIDQQIDQHRLVYPKDPVAGGTWLTISSRDLTLCVMNGAFQPHQMGGRYRMSRGLIALQIHRYPTARLFFTGLDLGEIEPFTMIVYERGELFEFRWDGSHKYLQQVDLQTPHIWASSTLYDAHWQRRRQFWFNQWLHQNPHPSKSEIMDFHLNAGDGDPQNDLVMNRSNQVCTVSICSVQRTEEVIHLRLVGLRNDLKQSREVPITKNVEP